MKFQVYNKIDNSFKVKTFSTRAQASNAASLLAAYWSKIDSDAACGFRVREVA